MKKLILILLALVFVNQALAQDIADYGTPIVFDAEGNPVIWKIDEDKEDEFFFEFVSFDMLLNLYRNSYDPQECVVNLRDRGEIKRFVNFRSTPNEFSTSNYLVSGGLGLGTILEFVEFVPRPSGSQYNWIKVSYDGKIGYVAEFALSCENR